ncbi:hypothetical protein BT93_F1337 [Corymbia citriodora subsp. variegata]|nr:hypothetical protein BT93_F1337 [Corymbia citriodora subsp. variegata]
MGRIFVVELEGRCYRCKFCETHLALAEDLISRAFHCDRGKAYLFSKAVNVTVGTLEDRMMRTGLHTVGDISCCCCRHIVGWKYETAHENSQKYKEGKFVLERHCLVGESTFFSDISIRTPSTVSPSVSDVEDA